jgi:hypothetical protein
VNTLTIFWMPAIVDEWLGELLYLRRLRGGMRD